VEEARLEAEGSELDEDDAEEETGAAAEAVLKENDLTSLFSPPLKAADGVYKPYRTACCLRVRASSATVSSSSSKSST